MIKSIDAINYNLSILNEKNAKVNTALSTGEAIEYGSDDSILYSHILNIKSDINTYSAIKENIILSQAYNVTSDDTIAQVKTTTESIIANLIKANTDTTSDENKEIISNQIEDYKNALFSLANTSIDGKYIFSGVNTDIQSFVKDTATGQVSYQSDNSLKKLNVEEATYVPQGANGIDVFYYPKDSVISGDSFTFLENEIILDDDENQWSLVDTNNDNIYDGLYLNGDTSTSPIAITDNGDGTYSATNSSTKMLEIKHSVFDDLDTVIAALKFEDLDGNTISSSEGKTIISEILDKISNEAYDAQNITHSVVGTRNKTIETYGDIVSSKYTNLTILEEKYAAADITLLAVQAQSLENTYAALYSTIGRVNSMSLVNYL